MQFKLNGIYAPGGIDRFGGKCGLRIEWEMWIADRVENSTC
jgi:hypothetical protein